MNLDEAITTLVKEVPNPTLGLPDPIFYYISRTTPLINVDLLIKDEDGRTLLSWRDDPYAGKGWHVPGGIVRFKETLEERISRVAEIEIGTHLHYEINPLAINQIIHPNRDIRGHFISLLYKCYLSRTFVPFTKGHSPTSSGYLTWHNHCPDDLIKVHEIYRAFM